MKTTKRKKRKQPVAVVGLGYVGLPLALLADKKGYQVIGIDIDARRISAIQKKKLPFRDTKLAKQLKTAQLEATTDFNTIQEAEIVVVCVPTPVTKDHLPDLEPLKSACEKIAPQLKNGTLVIIESTINPGVCETVVLPILEQGSRLQSGIEFFLSHCPERINPGDKHWDVENISRVIGSLEPVGLQKTLNFYQSLIKGKVRPMANLKEVEAVKIVENTFRDINIAFVNELAMSFDHLGIDVLNVIRGAATKPFSFMPHYPGCGVGGHCIPVDPYYLIEHAQRNGFNHRFLKLARNINNYMPRFTVEVLKNTLQAQGMKLHGSKIAVLGLSYKPEVSDLRESPSLKIIEHLKQQGAKVTTYDPYLPELSTATDLDETLKNAKAAIIVTAHNLFRKITPAYCRNQKLAVLIDGRNCLSKKMFLKAGVVYRGIGR